MGHPPGYMIDGMTTTPPQAVAKYQADIRAHIFYTRPGNDEPDLEVAFSWCLSTVSKVRTCWGRADALMPRTGVSA